ncbi:MAG: family 78 glycoside hydrolase catalytic domain, partial [Calditrichota bacterium]
YHANVSARYTLKGGSEETYAPRFFYKGFRYIEVTIDHPEGIDRLAVTGEVVHSGLGRNGSFASSDDLLNRIHELTRWAIAANTVSVPTDCPQREKLGYTGDGQVIAEASIHLFDMTQFYEKWLNDIGDAQHEDNGYVPRTAPEVRAGGGPGWGSACIFVPWDFYTYYGNKRILADHYQVMKRWATFLESKAKDGILHPYPINDNRYDFLGDWVPPGRGIGQTDRWTGPEMRMLTNTFVYHRNIQLLAKIADILGRREDATRYTRLADQIQTAFNARFLHPETNQYGDGRQPFNAFALADNLVPEARQPAVAGNIAQDIRERNVHLDTGISGTKFLFDALTERGYVDLAYAVATQTTYPSYGYWIKNGATTLREQWNGEYSHNHQMFGSIVAWFYKYLAGIRPLEPGYKKIAIKPYPPGDLKQVSATLETVHGEVSSAWAQQPSGLRMWVTLPANTRGVVSIPIRNGTDLTVTESGRVVWNGDGFVPGPAGIQEARRAGKYLEFTVDSGTYSFEVIR